VEKLPQLYAGIAKDSIWLSARSSSAYSPIMHKTIYKISTAALWREAEARGVFTGAPIDAQDGFIHFSTAAQAMETARRHFVGQGDLLIIAIDAEKLGDALKYEVSRGGDLFPHLYAPLDLGAVRWVKPLPLGADGHVFPELEA
jgi:uncharacterized protein (DUF952 family)